MTHPANWPADCTPCPKCGAEQQYEYPYGSTFPHHVQRWKRTWKKADNWSTPYSDSGFVQMNPESMEHSCTTCGYTVTTPCLDAKT